MNNYKGSIAGEMIYYNFRHYDTVRYFRDWLKPAEIPQNQEIVFVPDKDIQEQYQKYGIPDSAYAEFALSIYNSSDFLLSQGVCAFHGAAFLWNNKAYLFTGRSGTGKSTQLRNWCYLYGDETKVMNGDKPMIKAEGDHIRVYPSPWKGKERLGDDSLTAPLGGVVCLTQSESNQIRRLEKRSAGPMLLPRFLCRFEDRDTVLCVCKLANLILDTVPVWQLKNTGNLASTELVYETLKKEFSYA